jgi:hypothetical protein
MSSPIHKYHYITLDSQISPKVSLRNIIEGETGNRIWITFTNNGSTIHLGAKENGEYLYRVVLRVDSDLGTRYQDSAVQGDGVTLISEDDQDVAPSDIGKCNIRLKPDTFAAGLNRCWLKIYSTQFTEQDRMIYSAEFQFTALRDDSDGVNAWYRGSTPTHSMEVPIDLSNALVEVTYEQHGQVVCQVDNEQMTITPTKLTWTLLPQQTLAMEVGDIRIQLHYTNGTVTDYSDIHYGKVLYSQGV